MQYLLFALFFIYSPAIILVTEHWLDESVYYSSVDFVDYNFFQHSVMGAELASLSNPLVVLILRLMKLCLWKKA